MILAIVLDTCPALAHEPRCAVGKLRKAQSGARDLRSFCHMPIVAPEQVDFEVQPISIEHSDWVFRFLECFMGLLPSQSHDRDV